MHDCYKETVEASKMVIPKLKEMGYEIVSIDEDIADIYIVNTCTVTNMSDRKSRQILRKVKEFEFKNGLLGEYVFQDYRGRVDASRISDCAVNNTTTAEFHNKKSIHAIRRTLNSNMKCAGVSGTVAASLLGHTEKVNEENYTYDVSSMEEKSKFMECAGRV